MVFTAINTPQGLPRYRLVKNVLMVDPDGDGDFEFALGCRWGMDGAGNLKLSISGGASILDGFIEDSRSRFRFQFYDKTLANFPPASCSAGPGSASPRPATTRASSSTSSWTIPRWRTRRRR